MRRHTRAEQVHAILDMLIPTPMVPLHHTDPFTLLIAVLLSAQCTDERVNLVTPRLFALATTPETMSRLSIDTIQEIIRPCGLSRRKAEAIKKLSQEIVDRFHGHVPSTLQELESLPGIGHKSASVVLVQAFGIPAFPVDTHIFRCARRWGLSTKETVHAVEKDLTRLFAPDVWGKVHLQMILYARKYCPAKRHTITSCPICSIISIPKQSEESGMCQRRNPKI